MLTPSAAVALSVSGFPVEVHVTSSVMFVIICKTRCEGDGVSRMDVSLSLNVQDM